MRSFERDHFRRLRGPSDAVARFLDFFRLTPNIVTWSGLVLTVPMIWALATGRLTLGIVLFAVSALTDFLDGALARYQDANMSDIERKLEAQKPMLLRRGKTEVGTLSGAAIDPLVDKVRYFGAAFALGWHVLWAPLLFIGLAFAVLLTVLRIIYGKGKANMFGKYKAHSEIVLIAALWLAAIGVPYMPIASNVLLALATALGACSFAGQAYTHLKNRKNVSS